MTVESEQTESGLEVTIVKCNNCDSSMTVFTQDQNVANVQREHITFLREQLEHKASAYEQLWNESKAELAASREYNLTYRSANVRLRIALARAVERLTAVNVCSDDGNVPNKIDDDILTEWLDMAKGE